jgi:arylsulfatase A-like enzyme
MRQAGGRAEESGDLSRGRKRDPVAGGLVTIVAAILGLLAGAVPARASRQEGGGQAHAAPPAADPHRETTSPTAPPATPRNVVLITLDTVRADHLASYGYFRDPMPVLEAFAKDCLRVTRCIAPASHTTPSHASLFTSTYPLEHGIVGNSINESGGGPKFFRLDTAPSLQTVAQAARESGRRTGGFVAATPLKKFTGIHQGFDSWTEPRSTRRTGQHVVRDALRFIDAADDPFLLFVHLYDAHGPYQPEAYGPPEFIDHYGPDPALDSWLATRRIAATSSGRGSKKHSSIETCNQYAGSMRFLDELLRPLIERLSRPDRAADTVVAITADHGQGLGQHGFRGHGILWDEQLHVPLFLRVPGRPPATIDAVCSTLDVVPTLAGLVRDLVPPAFLEQARGQDLLAADFAPRPVFSFAVEAFELEGVTHGRFKLIRKPGGVVELFDHAADPHELKNVAAKHPDVVGELTALLDEEIRGQKARAKRHRAEAAAASALDPELAKELSELGYGAGGENSGDGDDSRDEPAADDEGDEGDEGDAESGAPRESGDSP